MLHSLWLIFPTLFAIWVFTQVRRPTGPLGRGIVRAMNHSHSAMTEWALQHVHIEKNAVILDVGCGGGRTVQRLAIRAPEGVVHGIDYSAASVAVSRAANSRAIAAGRVHVHRASVAALPFSDATFDVVSAVETHYYWPDLLASTREVLRVLKPDGTFILIAETYRGGRFSTLYGVVMALLRAAYLSAAEHRDLLTRSGFADVSTIHAPGTSWICATGRRPPEVSRSQT